VEGTALCGSGVLEGKTGGDKRGTVRATGIVRSDGGGVSNYTHIYILCVFYEGARDAESADNEQCEKGD
jgi:hypothetical protein